MSRAVNRFWLTHVNNRGRRAEHANVYHIIYADGFGCVSGKMGNVFYYMKGGLAVYLTIPTIASPTLRRPQSISLEERAYAHLTCMTSVSKLIAVLWASPFILSSYISSGSRGHTTGNPINRLFSSVHFFQLQNTGTRL